MLPYSVVKAKDTKADMAYVSSKEKQFSKNCDCEMYNSDGSLQIHVSADKLLGGNNNLVINELTKVFMIIRKDNIYLCIFLENVSPDCGGTEMVQSNFNHYCIIQ